MTNRSRWFAEDRFGMFVHFGLYSTPAGVWKGKRIKHPYAEWLQGSERVPRSEYQQLAKQFNPVGFDAEEWIACAKAAGMRYFVITSKHHDGFALWPTKASAYNVMDASPFKRDILGELAAACRKYDVKLGLYYSHWQDWEGTGGDVCQTHMVNEEYVHPSDADFARYWQTKCLPQVAELIERYDPWMLWFDSWNRDSLTYVTPERQDQLITFVRERSDKCLINSRIQFLAPSDCVDFISTMDNSFPSAGFDKPWETSGTLNHSWGYHQLDFQWKSTNQLLRYLIGNASLGGNYQLNVGPTGEGRFQPAAIKRLRDLGTWLSVNGESIYGTSASPIPAPSWGRITTRKLEGGATRLYLHLFDITPGTAVRVEGVTGQVQSARVLETSQPITASTDGGGLWVSLPSDLAGVEIPVIAVDVKG
jgi:alpha-L-fucosidase